MTNQRVEVITSVERRRRWSEAEKQAILTDAAETSVSAAARRAGVAASLVFRWRRQWDTSGMALPAPASAAASAFAPVRIAPEAPAGCLAGPGTIEIELATGARMRITGAVEVAIVTAAIAALAGMSLYAKRLERGRFIWPASQGETVTITPAQLGYLLEGIDWRNPVHSFRPLAAG
jgi:transposase